MAAGHGRNAAAAIAVPALNAKDAQTMKAQTMSRRFSVAVLTAAAFWFAAAFAHAQSKDLICLSEEDAWLVPVAVPIVGKLAGEEAPALLVTPAAPTEATPALLSQLACRNSLVLKTAHTTCPVPAEKQVEVVVVRPQQSQMRGALQIAKRIWGTSASVVVGATGDWVASILGSALAGHLKVPVVPIDPEPDLRLLRSSLDDLKATQVWVCVGNDDGLAPEWASQLGREIVFLPPRRITEWTIRTLGPRQVRNIIVARAPAAGDPPFDSAFLAAHQSVVRKAPIVLTKSSDGSQVEKDVFRFISSNGLRPRTITLLGSYDAISGIVLRDANLLADYDVMIEPCAGPSLSGAVVYGVGRIPYDTLADASLLLARGHMRARKLRAVAPSLLMLANPSTQYGPLPLAETVSRLTAEEFKNAGIKTHEFYGKPANDPEAVKAAETAHVILFEGHVTDQLLLAPAGGAGAGDDDDKLFTDGIPPGDMDTWVEEPQLPGIRPAADALLENLSRVAGDFPDDPGDEEPDTQPAPAPPQPEQERPDDDPPPDEQPADAPVELESRMIAGIKRPSEPSLAGMPLVILQSCHSLEHGVAATVFSRGGAGLIGSVTNIHSASGSAFMKTFCDGMIYRGETVGEALRDARNYFICLARLKAARGHVQQTKAYRVAMSFLLWGDPELRILERSTARLERRLLRASFSTHNQVQIATPARHLPECRTEKYAARIHPGAQVAGIVKRIKDKSYRRLMPLYFFRLDPPRGFFAAGYRHAAREGDTDVRAVFLPDPHERFVYLLYLPEKDENRADYILRFAQDAPPSRPAAP